MLGKISRAGDYALSGAVYAVIGGTAALTEWSLFFGLEAVLGMHYVGAAMVAFVIATAVNFALSRTIGFSSRGLPLRRELALVYVASGGALVANLGVMIALVTVGGLGPMAAKIAGTGVAFVLNYAFRQFVIFDRAPRWTLAGRFSAPPASASGPMPGEVEHG